MVELLYGLDADNRLIHIDRVPNGLACGCRCPGCGAPLVAKNNGETKASHFAHASGVACGGAHESELHLLAKEVIADAKAVMLPPYGNVYGGGRMQFDSVEVEERNDLSSLQPDLCGVVGDRRLWIEIMVTHAIGPEKRTLIRERGIACVEVNLSPFIGRQVTRQELQAFLLEDKAMREWTNNPALEQKRLAAARASRDYAQARHAPTAASRTAYQEVTERSRDERQAYLDAHPDRWIQPSQNCYACRHHSARAALLAEARRLRLPAWVKEVLGSNLLYWMPDSVRDTVYYDGCYRIAYDHYVRLLPTSSPDIHQRPVSEREIRQNEQVIRFLLETVPAILATEGLRCCHNVGSFQRTPLNYDIACDMPGVVNRHRR